MTFIWFKPSKKKWPRKCRVKFCYSPKLRPHHHHEYNDSKGGTDPKPCQCANPYIPGTRGKRVRG